MEWGKQWGSSCFPLQGEEKSVRKKSKWINQQRTINSINSLAYVLDQDLYVSVCECVIL